MRFLPSLMVCPLPLTGAVEVCLGTGKTVSALTAGSLAGLTAVALTYPLDMVRASMATPSSTHTSMAGAMQSIVQTRGVGALYSGISATMVGVAPYAGLKFSAYEGLKGVLGSVAGVQESRFQCLRGLRAPGPGFASSPSS